MDENLNFSFFARTIKEKLPTIMLFSLVGLLLGGYISFFLDHTAIQFADANDCCGENK